MTGSSILTMLMFLALALVAYAQAAPRTPAMHATSLSLFNRASSKHCPLGMHYSSFYGECSSWAQSRE